MPVTAWRLISHNVWGVGGPLPLTTPAFALQRLLQHHRSNPPQPTSSGTESATFMVVCLQEAFTSRISLPSYALTWLLCLPLDWLLNASWPPPHMLLWPVRAVYMLLASYHAILTHSVMIGPAISCYPRSLGRYVALALAMCLVLSALLTLIIALPYHLLIDRVGCGGGCAGGTSVDSGLLGDDTTAASPLSARLVQFYWRCLAFWLGLSVRARCYHPAAPLARPPARTGRTDCACCARGPWSPHVVVGADAPRASWCVHV